MNVRSIQVLVTRRCNLQCSYCHLDRDAPADLSWDLLRTSLQRLLERTSGELALTFTGGEPLLAFDTIRRCVGLVDAMPFRGTRVRWHVVTNGTLVTRDVLDFLDAHGFAVSLSFDGLPAAQAHRSEGTFHLLDNLLDLVKADYQRLFEEALKVRLTLTPATVPCLAESIEYLLDKDVRRIDVDPAFGPARWDLSEISVLQEQFTQVAELLRPYRSRNTAVPVGLFELGPRELKFGRKTWTCGAVRGSGVALDADGQCYACVFAAPAYQADTVPALRPAVAAMSLGRADAPDSEQRFETLEECALATGIFDHPERRYSSYRCCADCEFLLRCYACPLAASHDPACTDVRRVPDFLCAFNQVALAAHDRFWFAETPAPA